MKIELRELVDENNILSHVFLGCMPEEKLREVKRKYVGEEGSEKDWRIESVKIPVEMKIGGVEVNPKEFFDNWISQTKSMILDASRELVAQKLGSTKLMEMQEKLYQYQEVLSSWESEINWDVKNPFIEMK